jgi:hypothetical protein
MDWLENGKRIATQLKILMGTTIGFKPFFP